MKSDRHYSQLSTAGPLHKAPDGAVKEREGVIRLLLVGMEGMGGGSTPYKYRDAVRCQGLRKSKKKACSENCKTAILSGWALHPGGGAQFNPDPAIELRFIVSSFAWERPSWETLTKRLGVSRGDLVLGGSNSAMREYIVHYTHSCVRHKRS